MKTSENRYTLDSISRPSGGLAMLAIDQREAMRNMFAAAGTASPVPDSTLTSFKIAAAQELAPFASAVLVDRQFCYDAVIRDGTVTRESSLIVAADDFHAGNGVPVDTVTIDDNVDPAQALNDGAKAMKLLVLWRPDEAPEARMEMVNEFTDRAHDAGLLAIIEPVVRAPRHGSHFDREEAILAAAEELGHTDADLYKGEMPLAGAASSEDLYKACRELDDRLATPWVILSSGVQADLYPNAVRQAVLAGASGFLAGRAVWASVIGARETSQMLSDIAAPRLKRLGEIVDESLAARNS